MTDKLVRIGIITVLFTVLILFGNFINELFLVNYFTQFFVLLRTIIRPLMFIWDFQTSFILVGWSLSLFIIYLVFKAFLVSKHLLIGKN